MIGSSLNTGKPVGGDIREGKRTVLLADALSGADEPERAELIGMWEAPSRCEEQVRRAITLFASTGAIERSHGRIRNLWNASKSIIDALDVPDDRKELLIRACARFVPTVV